MLTYSTETIVHSGEPTDGKVQPTTSPGGQVQLTASTLPAGRPAHGWLMTALAYLVLATALMAGAVAAVQLGFLQ
jgi:hypothetical protein